MMKKLPDAVQADVMVGPMSGIVEFDINAH
jgi:hypothetical protein